MRLYVILSIILCWLFGLINESGWGFIIKSDEKMNWLILLWSLYLLIIKKRRFIPTLKNGYIIGVFLLFIIIPYFISNKWDGAFYMFSFLTIYCFSNINISAKELMFSSFIIGFLGLGLITVYLRTDILSGWNDNGIAMLALFSFVFFTTYFNSLKTKWQRSICWCIALIYILQIAGTDSRGAILFMSTSLFMVYARKFTLRYIRNNKTILFIVHFPLIIALITAWIASQDWFTAFDSWYQMEYTKPVFNGREILWTETLEKIHKYPFGVGEFTINYHNSAMACIGVFGIIGYLFWSKFFIKLLKKLATYFHDSNVYAFTCAFIIIYIQQSTELGFIKTTPNMLPYMILGLGLGRIRWYQKHNIWKKSVL